MWNDTTEKYIISVIDKCYNCKATSAPVTSRKVSLSSLTRAFNTVVCIDHLFLDQLCVFHAMDTTSRYSACYIPNSTSLIDSMLAFEASWLSQFWPPTEVKGDNAFNKTNFIEFLKCLGIEFRPVPPRKHSKNVLESKHGIIRSVYLRLKATTDDQSNQNHLVYQAVRISNVLYGSDTMSAFEMAKGYTVPIIPGTAPHPVPDEILSAQQNLSAKRKLTLILRSQTQSVPSVSSGDLVQVFIKNGKEKRGKWS